MRVRAWLEALARFVLVVIAIGFLVRSLAALLWGVGGLLVFGTAFLIGRRIFWSFRWTRPVPLLRDPVPEHWAPIVRANFPISNQLTSSDFERLLKLVQVFLRQKNIEGAGGLELDDEIRVTIAAQACFLILWLEVGMYPALATVIVYPNQVVPKYAGSLHSHGVMANHAPKPILGQSWSKGVVILSWNSARHGAADPRDGRNVVFHEFAHQLDQETGDADGIPVGLPLSALKPWAEVLERRFGELKRAEKKGTKAVLDTYGAKNRAEFFAVATEAFFEKPLQLRGRQPDLYALLVRFYGVDPAEGLYPTSTRSQPDSPDVHSNRGLELTR